MFVVCSKNGTNAAHCAKRCFRQGDFWSLFGTDIGL